MLTRLSKKPLLLGLGSAILIAVTCMIVGISFAEEKPDKLAEGDKQFEEKSYRKAYEAYVDYLKDHPDSADWFRIKLRMGHCQAQLGNHDKAEKELTELADKDGLSDLERGRADYRLGHYFMERPHYYYENSKGVKSWGNWIADSSYHNTQKEDTERAKDRLAASFKLLEPEGRKALKTLGENPDSVSMVEEAYNAGLDAAAALHTWQYQAQQERKSIDYFDANGQRQTYYYYLYKFEDRDEVIKDLDALVKLSQDLKQGCQSLLVQKREFPKDVMDAISAGPAKGQNMAALATYRKAQFLVALTQIDDWYMQNMLYNPDLKDLDPLKGEYSPIPVLETIYKDYHDTPYADDAQYFIGYCYQQVGQHLAADEAYTKLIEDADFKESTETSSARYNRQQLRAQRLTTVTVAHEDAIKDEKEVRKWANNASWYFRDNPGTERSLFKKGEHLGLWVETRNVEKYDVRALTFDAAGLMKDRDFLNAEAAGLGNIGDSTLTEAVKRYTGEQVFTHTYTTGDDGKHNYTRMTFELPQTLPPGAYLVEVDTGSVVDRRLVVVTDAQLVVQTYNPDENLAILVDSETGAPLSGTSFIYKRWNTWWDDNKIRWSIDVSRYTSDEQGRVRVPTVGNSDWDGYLL
ncbi:MAG: tetratricopeptide repeat protein, partial [Planctomycetes bacterium]|nr:tetratricopeptide repeat protein [Planctomycetota bacterium]